MQYEIGQKIMYMIWEIGMRFPEEGIILKVIPSAAPYMVKNCDNSIHWVSEEQILSYP